MSFAIIYKDQKKPKGEAILAFLEWAVGPEAQTMAKARNYAPLPASLQAKARQKIRSIPLQ
jgi:ABC-type phosphate transport system substrate-binding protein